MEQQKTIEVYRNACAQIASRLEPHGFKYFANGPKVKKISGDLTYEISFGTSMFNSNYTIVIDCHAWVKSKTLKKWRQSEPQCKNTEGKVSDIVAHSGIRYLPAERIVTNWNLVNPLERDRIVDQIVQAIENSVLPFFDKFQNPTLIKDELIKRKTRDLGMDDPSSFIEYAICFLSDEVAKLITISYLHLINETSTRIYKGLEDFVDAYENYSAMDLDANHRPNGHANEVAYYTVKYGWGNIYKDIG